MLDIMIPLLEGETVTYHGRYFSIDEVSIEPRTPRRPEIWIGGGSQLADPKSPDLPRFVESVKARVMRTDGWIPRPTCPPDEIARDWGELQDYYREHGRDPRECVVAHENFMHLVLTNDPTRAREEQHAAFLKVMSNERGPQYLETVYLFGTPDEIIASLQARIDAGVEYFMLHTMTPDPAQLQNWIDEIIPNLNFPVARAA
jgi:alkanesulfonate monooxygenase SsuD/methylene tetrahydromethanopterin reductase-like flavin-dependent oxidoreductase (luciferase family)